jgi:hypothetical protein
MNLEQLQCIRIVLFVFLSSTSALFSSKLFRNLSTWAQHVSSAATKNLTVVLSTSSVKVSLPSSTWSVGATSQYIRPFTIVSPPLLNTTFQACNTRTIAETQHTARNPFSSLFQPLLCNPRLQSSSPLYRLRWSRPDGHCGVNILVQRYQGKVLPSSIRRGESKCGRVYGEFTRSYCRLQGGLDGKLREVLWRVCVGCRREVC